MFALILLFSWTIPSSSLSIEASQGAAAAVIQEGGGHRFYRRRDITRRLNKTSEYNSQLVGKYRAALILTMGGQYIPKYLKWSCLSMSAAQDMYDLLIFHEDNTKIMALQCPPNVIKINLYKDGLATIITKTISRSNSPRVLELLKEVLTKIPYFLAQFKIASGAIFAKYLKKYTHWTYTDPDIIWGDLSHWVPAFELEYFDIITLAKFYDASRLFLRGQFALHRNEQLLNTRWKGLWYFNEENMVRRLGNILTSVNVSEPVSLIKAKFFVSAEGAYSLGIFRQNISALIAGRMYLDNDRHPVIWMNGILYRCYCPIVEYCIKASAESADGYRVNPKCLRSDPQAAVALPPPVLLEEVTRTWDCDMNWLKKQQLCLFGRGNAEYPINEVIYKEWKWYVNDEIVSRRIRHHSSALFHFRLWEDKRSTSILDDDDYAVDAGHEGVKDYSCFITYLNNGTLNFNTCKFFAEQQHRLNLVASQGI